MAEAKAEPSREMLLKNTPDRSLVLAPIVGLEGQIDHDLDPKLPI